MNLYQSQQVYQLDRLAMDKDSQPSRLLMGKAALALWRHVQRRWPDKNAIAVFAGPGNNGGDAFALADLARKDGYAVELFTMGDMSRQSAESAYYRQRWESAGGILKNWQGQEFDADLIIDGLLGIGLNKALDAEWRDLIETINRRKVIRVSIDIPSGLQANRGIAMPVAIKADLTVTFIGRKLGCFIGDGPDYCGQLEYDDLGLSGDASSQLQPIAKSLEVTDIRLPHQRNRNSHKNDFGHVLVIGGDRSMSGAVRLAGLAALRCGAGLVSLCVHPDNYAIAAAQQAELMVSDWNNLDGLLRRADVVVIGPGLGQSDQARAVLQALHAIETPMVVDADALNSAFLSALQTDQAVLTPHPGEAGRLLNLTGAEVQSDRLAALLKLNEEFQYACVLKGAGTLVGQHQRQTVVCRHGHPGMATAGMGDVLAGMIAAYLAQGLDPLDAARTAVLIHALAADEFAADGDEYCLIASDVIDRIAAISRQVRAVQAEA